MLRLSSLNLIHQRVQTRNASSWAPVQGPNRARQNIPQTLASKAPDLQGLIRGDHPAPHTPQVTAKTRRVRRGSRALPFLQNPAGLIRHILCPPADRQPRRGARTRPVSYRSRQQLGPCALLPTRFARNAAHNIQHADRTCQQIQIVPDRRPWFTSGHTIRTAPCRVIGRRRRLGPFAWGWPHATLRILKHHRRPGTCGGPVSKHRQHHDSRRRPTPACPVHRRVDRHDHTAPPPALRSTRSASSRPPVPQRVLRILQQLRHPSPAAPVAAVRSAPRTYAHEKNLAPDAHRVGFRRRLRTPLRCLSRTRISFSTPTLQRASFVNHLPRMLRPARSRIAANVPGHPAPLGHFGQLIGPGRVI